MPPDSPLLAHVPSYAEFLRVVFPDYHVEALSTNDVNKVRRASLRIKERSGSLLTNASSSNEEAVPISKPSASTNPDISNMGIATILAAVDRLGVRIEAMEAQLNELKARSDSVQPKRSESWLGSFHA